MKCFIILSILFLSCYCISLRSEEIFGVPLYRNVPKSNPELVNSVGQRKLLQTIGTTSTSQFLWVNPIVGCPSLAFTVPVLFSDNSTLNLLLDTGSTTLAAASTKCKTCSQTLQPKFNPFQAQLISKGKSSVGSIYG